jgi:NDP-mannose synthase
MLLGDCPVPEVIPQPLKVAGLREIILAVGHLSEIFQALLQDDSRYGLKIVVPDCLILLTLDLT